MLSPYGYGRLPDVPAYWWPMLESTQEYADFSYDASVETTGGTDPIVALTMAVAPAGAGEVIISRLVPIGSLITVWLTGGVPGRTYIYRLVISTQAGRVLPVLIGQVADPVTAICPLPPPPLPGFGTPVSWP